MMEGRQQSVGINLKTPLELESMRTAGRLASEVLDFITPHVKPGVTTGQLDQLCHEYMVKVQSTVPAPLNYAPPGHRPYPKSICTSVNHRGMACPAKCCARAPSSTSTSPYQGRWHGHPPHVLVVSPRAGERLCETTYECMWLEIRMVSRARAWATSATPSSARRDARLSVVRGLGHGIGGASTRSSRSCTTAAPGSGWPAGRQTFTSIR